MKKVFLLTLLVLFGTFEVKAAFKKNEKRILSEQVLKDKVKGAWAGQTLGCSYGGPTEFKFLGTIIQDYIPIPWNEHMVKKWYDSFPGLYDDVYVDLTFVEVFERCGLDAPVDSFAVAFKRTEYPLWHANYSAKSGLHWAVPNRADGSAASLHPVYSRTTPGFLPISRYCRPRHFQSW